MLERLRRARLRRSRRTRGRGNRGGACSCAIAGSMSRPIDGRAARQQRLDAGLADAGGGAGHERHLAGEQPAACRALRSLACSRSQYSTSKMSFAGSAC
ncbi:MAG: hypothetical protein MZV65_37850 [Chromatiales bacterium]|nr:hypothetical protein [Chromatiales bacterium]